MKIDVYVLTLEHEYGTDVTLHTTEAAATKARNDFAAEWWSHELGPDVPMPSDPDQAAAEYFERVESDGYSIEQASIELGGPAPDTSIVRCVWSAEDVASIAEEHGIDPDTAQSRAAEWGRHIADTANGLISEQLETAITTGGI